MNVWHDARIETPPSGKEVLCVKENEAGHRSICFGAWWAYGTGWVTSGSCNNVIYWTTLPKIPEKEETR